MDLAEILIPLGICVVMPVSIVWLSLRSKNHSVDKRTEVLLKSVENGAEIDTNLLMDSVTGPKTLKLRLLNRLQAGCILTLIGIASLVLCLTVPEMQEMNFYLGTATFLALGAGFLIGYFVGRRFLASEIKAEEEQAAMSSNGDIRK